MVKYLALSSVWKACTGKNFSGLEQFFCPTNFFPNLMPCQNELSSPSMVEYLALSSAWKACPEKKRNNPFQRLEALCILNAKLRVPVKIKPVKNLRVPSFIIPI